MKQLNTLLILIVISIASSSFYSTPTGDNVSGKVIWEGNNCDYYIIETNKWYVLVDWYNGSLYEGDKVIGDLHSYNFKYLTNMSRNNSEVKVWIENYWGYKERCFEWLKEHDKCDFDEEN